MKEEKQGLIKEGVSWMIGNMNFVVFVTILGLIYIANAHSVERKIRNIDDLKVEVEDAKYNYIKVKKEIMHPTTASQLAKQLEAEGLKINKEKPIVLKSENS